MTAPRLCQRCGAPVMHAAPACGYCGVAFEGAPLPPAPAAAVDPEVAKLLASGNKIGAIKVYRERTRCDLVTAKDAVEAIERRLRR